MTYIPVSLRRQVEERANFCCEYCLLSQAVSFYSHEVDHVIALKHGGQTNAENLAFVCWRCNSHKGSDLGSFDPETGGFSFLFHPRRQVWAEHFVPNEDSSIQGLTAEGRTTAKLLVQQRGTPCRATEGNEIRQAVEHNTWMENTAFRGQSARLRSQGRHRIALTSIYT